MSNTKERGFLDEILADPDDDFARLIYADWLEENGKPERAELIRIQIERATLPKRNPRQIPLLLREQELIQNHGKEWTGELPDLEGVIWTDFHRGFISAAHFDSFSVLDVRWRIDRR